MRHIRLESNRNDKLINQYRTGVLLFIAGAAIGASATLYFTNLDRRLLVDSIEKQTKAAKAMSVRERTKGTEIGKLQGRNLFLEHQNQKFWVEHARMLKRIGKCAVVKQEPLGKAKGAKDIAAVQLPAPLTEAKAEAPKETKDKKKGFFSMFR